MNHCTPAAFALLILACGCDKPAEAAGRGGTTLALNDPSNQTLVQGAATPMSISVERHGFADAVQVSFANLPTGVRVQETSILAGESRRDFVLIAAPDAQIVDKQVVTVTARASGASPSQPFELTIRAK